MLHFKTNGPASKRFPTRINQIINFHERVSKSRQSGVATTWLSTRINHQPNFHERVSKSRQSGVATKRLSTRINRPFNFHERVPKSRQSEVAISHMRKNQKVTVLPDRLGERIHLELECHPIQLHYSISPEYA